MVKNPAAEQRHGVFGAVMNQALAILLVVDMVGGHEFYLAGTFGCG
jgi:hypothetical protein